MRVLFFLLFFIFVGLYVAYNPYPEYKPYDFTDPSSFCCCSSTGLILVPLGFFALSKVR